MNDCAKPPVTQREIVAYNNSGGYFNAISKNKELTHEPETPVVDQPSH